MEKLKISKEKLIKIKDILIFILLFLWMIMPILQSIKKIEYIIEVRQIYFRLMKTIAFVGIGTSIMIIYNKFKNSDNKKQVFKQLLPIFIFIIYMIWTLISCYQARIRNNAFHGNSYRKEGYFMYINYAGFFLCAVLLDNKKLRKTLLNAFIITSLFLMTINRICLDAQRYKDIFVNTQIDDSVFLQFNHYGYYIMMSLICALGLFMQEKNKVIKILYLISYTLIGYALIYNDTFGCYLATCLFLIMYAIYALIKKTDRKTICVAIAIFILLSCVIFKNGQNLAFKNLKEFFGDINTIVCKILNIEIEGEDIDEKFDATGTQRMELWVNGIKFIWKKPIIGYGPDNVGHEYLMNNIGQDRPHNLIIYLACVSGIPGMLLYVTAVGIIVVKGIKKLFKKDKHGMIYLIVVITYLISSMFGNSMYYTSPYFFIFLGSLMHYNLKEKEE